MKHNKRRPAWILFLVVFCTPIIFASRADARTDWGKWFRKESARKVPQAVEPVLPAAGIDVALPVRCDTTNDSFSHSVSVVQFSSGLGIPCVGTVRVAAGEDAGDYEVTFKPYAPGKWDGREGSVDYSELAPVSVTVACEVLREAYLKSRPVTLSGNYVACGVVRTGVKANSIGIGTASALPDTPHAFPGFVRGAIADATGYVGEFSVYSDQADPNCSAKISSAVGIFEASGTPFSEYYTAADALARRQYAHQSLNMCSALLRAHMEARDVVIKSLIYNPAGTVPAQVSVKSVDVMGVSATLANILRNLRS